jgi:hypothetical protein
MPVAWVRRNCRHVVSVRRTGAGWDPVTAQDPADRRGSDAVAEGEQFTADALVSPIRVVRRHLHHQRGDGVVDRRATRLPVRVGPLPAHYAAMPA